MSTPQAGATTQENGAEHPERSRGGGPGGVEACPERSRRGCGAVVPARPHPSTPGRETTAARRSGCCRSWQRRPDARLRQSGRSRADARERWLLLLLVFGALASEQTIGVLMPLAADAQGTSYAWIGMLSGTLRLVLVLLLIPGLRLSRRGGGAARLLWAWDWKATAALTYAIIPMCAGCCCRKSCSGWPPLFWPAYLSYFAEVVVGAETQMQMRRSLTQGVALLDQPAGRHMSPDAFVMARVSPRCAMTVTIALLGFGQQSRRPANESGAAIRPP